MCATSVENKNTWQLPTPECAAANRKKHYTLQKYVATKVFYNSRLAAVPRAARVAALQSTTIRKATAIRNTPHVHS